MKSRRQFLNATFSACTNFGVATALTSLNGRLAFGEAPSGTTELVPTKDETTGVPLLRLPEGFRYVSYGWTEDRMSDGTKTPAAHDGMGVVKVDGDILTLIRNHELSTDGKAISSVAITPWDPNATAGCTSLKFDTRKGRWLESRVAMSGSSRNCAGGITPWGSWLT